MIKIFRPAALVCLLAAMLVPHAGHAAESLPLPPDARVAIVGDSITEQKLYSKYIETYLLACLGRKDITCFQFGWSGETAAGFNARVDHDLSVFNPTVVTLCYGMNDGGYVPYNPGVGAKYEANMRDVLAKLGKIGAKQIVVGTPGAVDSKFFTRPGATPDQYNDSLVMLGAIGQKLALEQKLGFANVHATMSAAMAKAKATNGEAYDVGGRDGVHPAANGHLLMAMAFLKSLGCDGNIGEITLDMTGTGSTSGGHRIVGGTGSSVEIESTTWPFCFDPDPKESSSNRSILPFCSFNEDLNRFILKVNHLGTAKAKVSWGSASKEFSREQLTAGINLAAEFPQTPFDAAFKNVMASVAGKQAYETTMIKGFISNFRGFAADIKEDAEFASALGVMIRKLKAKHAEVDAFARRGIVPLKHQITVVEVR